MDVSRLAPLFCAGITVYAPLKRHLKSGFKVGIAGIGGLGHLAL
jgi:D-arabinose 1-dehydrogenase-like Zn-dependent alcohol dehydrogenase